MAPEVISGDPPSPASDLYGAGVILYELLTGTTPFGGGTATEIMLRHARDKVTPPSQRRPDRGIPPVLDGVVLKALAKRPDARFCDAAAFAREVHAAAQAAASRIPSMAPGHVSLPAPADVSAAPPRRPLARGSDCSGARHTMKFELPRRAIADAMRRGDVAAIADGYLRLARALAGRQQFAPAASELEEALDVVTAGGAAVGGDAARAVDRLVVALASLYEEAGDRRLARWVATSNRWQPDADLRDRPSRRGALSATAPISRRVLAWLSGFE